MITEIQLASNYTVITCCNCGIHFAVPSDFKNKRVNDHDTFYCPSGHSQYFPGKTQCELTKERNQELRNDLDDALYRIGKLEGSRRALKAHLTIKKKKIEELKEKI